MTSYHEPVFLGVDGRRCGESLPYDMRDLLVYATESETADRIREALNKRRTEQKKPLYWTDFL